MSALTFLALLNVIGILVSLPFSIWLAVAIYGDPMAFGPIWFGLMAFAFATSAIVVAQIDRPPK